KRRVRGRHDVGDVGGQLDDHRDAGCAGDPARYHLAVLGHLTHSRAHAALAHAVRAAVVKLYAVGARVFYLLDDRLPRLLVARYHGAGDDGPVGPQPLDLFDLLQVDLDRPVGDELHV